MDQCYRTQYTSRYQPVLQLFAMLHICDVVARFFPGKVDLIGKDGAEAIKFGMESLMQVRAGYPIAGPFEELLLQTANECSIHTSYLRALSRPRKRRYRMDDFVDACTRLTYCQPVEDIHLKYQLTFAIEWMAEGLSLRVRELGPGTVRSRAIPAEKGQGAGAF
jgi:hypothetical protein